MTKQGIVAAIAAALVTSSAVAADLAVKEPLPPPCLWCGLYIGGNAGWAWGRDAVTTTSFFPTPPFLAVDVAGVNTAASPALTSNGLIGGAQIGYNWQIGRAVLGLEADADFPSLKSSQAGTFPFPSTLPGGAIGPPTAFFTTSTSVSTDWLVTLRPRVGVTENNWLFYVTGGVAAGRENFSQTINIVAPFVLTDTFSTTQIGWTAGAGIEAKLNPNLSIKAEYLYIDLGTTPANAGLLVPPAAASGVNSAMRLTTSIARVGLNWHFNGLTWWSQN
jgi:outer membrane immunogenic protein